MPNGINCPNGMPYTIKAGDTFYLIARTYGISVDALLAANPGVNPDRLFIGQVICVPTGSTPTPPPSTSCPLLRQGNTGADVRDLQTRLRNVGFDPGPIDGIFGPTTHAAVIAFQRSRGLVPDGLVGVLTWTALGKNCSQPTTCPAGTFPYIIRSGDTFFVLAQRFNTTVSAIQRANPNVNPNALQIGQQICIPR
ncbi:LysM peptidoglycan-binding domain-containing protein [Tissierella sp. Yu-01]|jgi:LysM repeat protein|uniref:LysM peptidoglycan-binding domain-containing protein n=1 Tax=Tissierella sp. Yu-01 TaxID=3035694 RepID=UPI00240E1770|nr:LysM peptidoglycan-binding domain-containing protein [Tissierella sp. Yu-01]WFA08341.1 LysM peptidoglycan-binding domain-containing protein [Tissierella sp. Yu-01]